MAGVNNIVREIAPKSIFDDASAVTSATEDFNQGDLLVLDSGVIKKAAAEADGATFLGVSKISVVDGKLLSPYSGTAVDAAQAKGVLCGPVYGVVAKLILKTGEALAVGGLVYLDPATGGRGVAASGTKAIGVYQGAAIASAVAGQQIEVLVGARFPQDALKF